MQIGLRRVAATEKRGVRFAIDSYLYAAVTLLYGYLSAERGGQQKKPIVGFHKRIYIIEGYMWVGDEGTVYDDRAAPAKLGLLRQFADWLEARHRTPDELLGLCTERITERDAQVHAWVQVAPQRVLGTGPLSGIPFGVKDIFETKDLATEYGSPLYAGRKGSRDATLVTQFRQHGAVLIGKTHTTAFAYFDAGPTRNPHNLAHTPGGSSSGSA